MPTKKKKKVNLPSQEEILESVGHESEKKGIKYVKEFMALFEKKEWEENQIKRDHLSKKSRFSKKNYYRAIVELINSEVADLDLPTNYMVWGELTKQGVIVTLKDRFNKTYSGAFTPCGTPKVDFYAVTDLLGRALDTADRIEDDHLKNIKDLGIILPA